MEEGFDKNAHAAVFVADDIDEVAAGGGIAGDGVVLEHFAGKTDGGDGGFDFVGHVVDEVGFHLVQSVLGEDSADGEDEEGGDEENHQDADDGVAVGVGTEDDGGGGEGEDDKEAFAGGDSVGVESVFESGIAQFVGVGLLTAVEQGVGVGFNHPDGGGEVDTVDNEFFADEGVEEGEVEFGGVDGAVDGWVGGLGVGSLEGALQTVAGVEEGVVLADDVFFGRLDVGVGEGENTVLGGNAELDAFLVVEELSVVADDVLHFLVHFVDAAVAKQEVSFLLGDIVLDFHLVQLVEDFVDGVVDTDVKKVVAHLGRFAGLVNLDDDEANGGNGEER